MSTIISQHNYSGHRLTKGRKS